jgi:hypothetical protein
MIINNGSSFTPGRTRAHEFKDILEVSLALRQVKATQSRNEARMFELDLDCESDFFHHQSSLPMADRTYMLMISDHDMSYDQYSRPYKFYEFPKVNSPHTQFSAHGYYETTDFLVNAS